jgi:hypothetical protein
MEIDCHTCTGRGRECHDCVVMVLLGEPPEVWTIDDQEASAFETLAQAGLVPPLRHDQVG